MSASVCKSVVHLVAVDHQRAARFPDSAAPWSCRAGAAGDADDLHLLHQRVGYLFRRQSALTQYLVRL
jgi:hypothetical protein